MGSDDPTESLAGGTVVGDRYRIIRRRAAGGMGEVYLARHLGDPGHVAVKVLGPSLRADARAVARFAQEAQMLTLMRHPNVVRLIDFDLHGAMPFLVMEHLDGPDLSQLVSEDGPLSVSEVTGIVLQVARALEHVHACGIVHCDVKPSNVVLVEQPVGLAKLIDFGVARYFGAGTIRVPMSVESASADMLGTPAYMAPEQAQGLSTLVDGRADQFALAAMAYALLSGQDPFSGARTADVVTHLLHDDPAPLTDRLGAAAAPIESVLRRALSKDPESRYPKVSDLSQALAGAARVTADWPASTRRARRRRQAELATCPVSLRRIVACGGPGDNELVAAARVGYQTTSRLGE
jgi:serine/threonine-protein kinase